MPDSHIRRRSTGHAAAALVIACLTPFVVAVGVPADRAQGTVLRAAERPAQKRLHDVMFVGNNWSGTATVVNARTRRVLARGIDLVPDKEEELARIHADPLATAYYLAIQQGPGEGHDQYVDDMFTTRDGRYLAVSRPSFADVVWIDIEKAVEGAADAIVREQQMDGYRTDHMAVSPDGRRLLVSDSTARQVVEYSMVRGSLGERLRSFESGETPHESNYTADGSRILHASIGRVYTPVDQPTLGPVDVAPVQDAVKGDQWFQQVRTRDFDVRRRWDMGEELAEAGHPGMSSAVRPMALAPDERFVYLQVSWFHGLVEFDTRAPDLDPGSTYTAGSETEPARGAVRRVVPLPNRVPDMPREQYVNDSAHHGLSIDESGTTLCVAGTMDDYAALVDRRTMRHRIFDERTTGHSYAKPYWTTEGPRDTCWVSLSEADAVAVLDVGRRREVAYLDVGDHPQRIRQGRITTRVRDALRRR